MKIIVGLGNPGTEYENTRHNLGYKVIDKLSEELGIEVDKNKFTANYGYKTINGEKIILLKPLTYMNLSGDSVIQVANYYKVDSKDIIVIYDDIDIQVGKIRIKPSGGPGTHNGMRDIVKKLSKSDFVRVRVGSGSSNMGNNLADYVLSNFRKEEIPAISEAIKTAKDSVLLILNEGVESAMNKYN